MEEVVASLRAQISGITIMFRKPTRPADRPGAVSSLASGYRNIKASIDCRKPQLVLETSNLGRLYNLHLCPFAATADGFCGCPEPCETARRFHDVRAGAPSLDSMGDLLMLRPCAAAGS
jgi:hypothetical protein